MSQIKATILLNKLIDGTTNITALQTYLGTSANVSVFNILMNSQYHCELLAKSQLAMTTICGSALAMAIVAESKNMKKAIFNNYTAFNTVAGSTTALTALRASRSYHVVPVASPNATNLDVYYNRSKGNYLLLGLSCMNASGTVATNPTDNYSTSTGLGSGYTYTSAATSSTSTTADTISLCLPIDPTYNIVVTAVANTYFGVLYCDA